MRPLLSLCVALGFFALVPACDTVADGDHVVGVHIDSIIPQQVPASGGVLVSVIGRNFDAGTVVTVGGVPAVGVTAVSGELLTFVTPKGKFGGNDVAITNSTGQHAEQKAGLVLFAERVAFAEQTVLVPGFDFGIFELVDLNNDGLDDIVAMQYAGAGAITIRMNLGGGAFAAPVPLASTTSFDFSFADLDGDGDTDIVTSAEIYRNHGDGTFAAPLTYANESGFGRVLADFTGDGITDVLVFQNQQTTIYGLVDGAPVTHKVIADLVVAYSPAVAADLDEDGKADLIFSDFSQGGNCTAIRRAPSFDAASGSVVCGGYNEFTQALVARDLDGDKHIDLIAQSSTSTSTLRGDGKGSLAAPETYASICGASSFSRFITPPRPSNLLYASCGSGALSVFSIGLTSFSQIASLDLDAHLGDIDGDGLLDAVSNDFRFGISVQYGDSTQAGFSPFPTLWIGKKPVKSAYSTPYFTTLASNPPLVAAAWFDTVTLYRKGADAPLPTPIGTPLLVKDGAWVAALYSADLDGDGDKDLLAFMNEPDWYSRNQAYLLPIYVDGDRLTVGEPFANNTTTGVWLADLDGDKRAEVITYVYNELSISVPKVYRNRVEGFVEEDFATADGRMVFADVDGDGDDDEIAYGSEPSVHLTLHRMQDGIAIESIPLQLGVANDPLTSVYEMGVQSFGDSFALWQLSSTKTSAGVARVTFASSGAVKSAVFTPVRGSSLRLGDVDGDGVLDAIVTDRNAAFTFAGRSPTLNARTPVTLGSNAWTVSPYLFDFDGDGLDEVYFTSPSQYGKLVIVPNQSE